MEKRILIVTGEVSGDLHGGNLAKALLESEEGLELSGIGGEHMARAGVKILFPGYRLSVIGLSGLLRKIWLFLRAYLLIKKELVREGLAALILIDFPGFNLFLAKKAKKLEIPVVYYIAPQVWAWRRSRIKKIAKRVDLMLVILPFEEEIFREAGIQAHFVGHPLADTICTKRKREDICRDYNYQLNQPIIGLLPGSRHSEIERMLPVMLQATVEINKRIPEAQFFILAAPGLEVPSVSETATLPGFRKDGQAENQSSFPLIEAVCRREGLSGIKIISKTDYDLMACADFLIIASGTATLEAAMLGVPFLIVYLTDRLTYFLARRLVKIPYIGLVNVIAKRFVVPEFIQDKAQPEALAESSLSFLRDPDYAGSIRKELQNVCQPLCRKGVSQRAAKEVLKFLVKEKR